MEDILQYTCTPYDWKKIDRIGLSPLANREGRLNKFRLAK